MIQADAVSTPPVGLFATLISRLFSGVAQPAARRAPNIDERATMRGIAIRIDTAIEGHLALADAALVAWVDREVLEPLRDLVRAAATTWAEPYRGMLADALYEGDGTVFSFHEKLIDRADVIDGLCDLEHTLRLIARTH